MNALSSWFFRVEANFWIKLMLGINHFSKIVYANSREYSNRHTINNKAFPTFYIVAMVWVLISSMFLKYVAFEDIISCMDCCGTEVTSLYA